jgi:cystathionine beta-lyase
MIASEAAYSHGEKWLGNLMQYLRGNYELVKEFLEEHLPPVKFSPLEATYLLWMDFRQLNIADDELKKVLVEKAGIGMNDGPMFGPGGEGFQRMNIACPRDTVEKALERLKGVF